MNHYAYVNTSYGSLYSGEYKTEYFDHDFFDEIVIDRNSDRTGWKKLFSRLQPGDRITVFTICELSESNEEICWIIDQIYAKGANLICVQENFDTRNPCCDNVYALFEAIDYGRERNCSGFEKRFRSSPVMLTPATVFESF